MHAAISAAGLAVLLAASTALGHAAPAPACQAVVSLSNAWASPQGDATFISLNLNVINLGSTLIPVPWTLVLTSPAYGIIRQVRSLLLQSPAVQAMALEFVHFMHHTTSKRCTCRADLQPRGG